MGQLLYILLTLALPVLLAFSAFFSGSETALFSLSRHQRVELGRSKAIADRAIVTLLHETRALLITLLLSNMLVNVLYFVISTVLMLRLGEQVTQAALVLTVLSITQLLVLILCGEVMPKLIASSRPLWASRLVAIPLLAVQRALTPLRTVVQVLVVTPAARLVAPRQASPELSAAELASLLELSQHHGVIDRDEERMLQQVLTLGQLRARDLFTPRVDMQGFDLEDDPASLVELIRTTRLRQIPVYRGNLDHIVGIATARQVLLRRPTTAQQVQALLKPAMFVPEIQRADKLLVHLRRSGAIMAIVVDEFGGTAGLVTLEDVVEQMVGQIAGGYETYADHPIVEAREPGVWRVSGDLSVHEWKAALGRLDQLPGVSTLAGLVMAKLGRMPHVGDTTQLGNVAIEVLSMSGRRIQDLQLRVITPSVNSGTGDTP